MAPAEDAVRFNVEPAHIGLLLPKVGAGGAGFTTTVMVDCELVQPDAFAVTVYVPAPAVIV